jgi:hypothetical protein
MSSEPTPLTPAAPVEPFSFGLWWNRLGLSGRLMAVGGTAGIVACLLPALSTSISGSLGKLAGIQGSRSVLVVESWEGVLGLFGFAGAVALCFLLYGARGPSNRALYWAPVGIGAVLVLLSLLLLVTVLRGSQTAGFGGIAEFKISPGIGAFAYLLTAAVVTGGAVLKAREVRLF